MDDNESTSAPEQPKTGGRGLLWGSWLTAIGIMVTLAGNSISGDDGTKSELLGGGLMTGIGGILAIVGIIAVVVGLVGRSRGNRSG